MEVHTTHLRWSCWNIAGNERDVENRKSEVITFVFSFFFIFIPCLFHCESQRKTQTFEFQQYPLPQAHLYRWDADNHRIKLNIEKASSI